MLCGLCANRALVFPARCACLRWCKVLNIKWGALFSCCDQGWLANTLVEWLIWVQDLLLSLLLPLSRVFSNQSCKVNALLVRAGPLARPETISPGSEDAQLSKDSCLNFLTAGSKTRCFKLLAGLFYLKLRSKLKVSINMCSLKSQKDEMKREARKTSNGNLWQRNAINSAILNMYLEK